MLTMTLNLMKPSAVAGDPRLSAAWGLVGAVFTMIVVAFVAGMGCAPMSEEEAAAAWSSVGKSFNDDDSASQAQQALSVDASVSATFDCRVDGEMDLTSTLDADADDGDVGVAFAYDVGYRECQPDEQTLDGDLRYRAALSSERIEDDDGEVQGRETVLRYDYDGVIVVTDSDGVSRECVVDASAFASASSDREVGHEFPEGAPGGKEFRASRELSYEGSICGHDAERVAHASVDVSVSADGDAG